MKSLLPLALLGSFSASLWAADARAVLIREDEAEQVWITAASATNVQYKTTEASIDQKRMARSNMLAIFFYEPDIYRQAMALYESRDYTAAKEKFIECAEAFKKVEEIPGNYGTLAGFYAIECCRKLEQLEEISQRLENYRPGSLVRETHKNQFEVYTAWDAVKTKSWPRLVSLTTEMLSQNRWTGSQLAQIYYCRGLAFEGVGKPKDALNAFNGAFTADFTHSEEITRKATLNCLRILQADEEVQLAMTLYGTPDEDPNSNGFALLQEAVALAELWNKALGGGQALPAEHKELLKFKAKTT